MPSLTGQPPPADTGSAQRRPDPRTRNRRLVALGVVGAAAFAVGALAGGGGESERARAAREFSAAWTRSDYRAMHDRLSPDAKRRVTLERFTRAYQQAAATLTLTGVSTGRIRDAGDDVYVVPVASRTRVFGTLRGSLRLPVVTEDDETGVAWRPDMVLPGLRPGERVARETQLPPRGTLQARDGTVIARGEERTGELGPEALDIVGRLGPAPPERRAALVEQGVPLDAPVGITGLERQFDDQLRGRPGGTLRAGARVLARTTPAQAGAVRTTIAPGVQKAAVDALAGRYGGVAVLRPDTGEVLGLAGVAYSGPQPPGSVFKIITLSGALEAGTVKPTDDFPVETAATLEGVQLQNAYGEACGGTLRESFAKSCNSVFAPMGAELGAERLVAAAERFGFNERPSLAGAAVSTIPQADQIGDDLAVGSTAIGQGEVLATPLTMAGVGAAIANGGRRVRPTLSRGGDTTASRATTPRVARLVRRSMQAVVTGGTGVAAQIEGVKVAGKTGTAELTTTQPTSPTGDDEDVPADDAADTDAWFVAFAPAGRPRVAVAVVLVGQGAGGETAAPAAKTVLQAALR